MRKNGYLTSAMLLLLTCSVLLAACDAITAQNITNTASAQGMNGGGMMNGGGPGMNGGTQRGMRNADLTGRVVSATGSTVTIALLEVQDNASTGSTNGNGRQPGGSRGESMNMKDTGIEMKLNIGDDVKITEGMGIGAPGNNQSTDSSIQVSDLKEGDVVMVWYKENTKTVERMVVTQF
ncbi:hypothetical protein JNUCC31_19115 [Paenibacillus sp. JNUCC31]|uniref:hypothetical protein n=1 Tax=Paenibacillus sp. JNUCC-31 TaxID=2777983 RepID=UPI0017840799|nr:hypothetical protein [Paenibacillus sp. JNUCC-31]QOS76936.1 hypothetical protein JNUCC31_19115 [Paenibacillus sp. JNUCC-31]